MKKIWKNLCLCLLVLVSSISFFACKKDNKSMSVDLDGDGVVSSWETLYENEEKLGREVHDKDVVLISSFAQLKAISNEDGKVSKSYKLMKNINCNGESVSIDLKNSVLYGNNKYITNFKLGDVQDGVDSSVVKGLFYNGIAVYDLRVFMGRQDYSLSDSGEVVIAPFINTESISDIEVKGFINIDRKKPNNGAGSISTSLCAGDISIINNINYEGENTGNSLRKQLVKNITNVNVLGKLNVKEGELSNFSSNVGGIISSAGEDCYIHNCNSSLDMRVLSSGSMNVGMIVGANSGFVSTCTTSGKLNTSTVAKTTNSNSNPPLNVGGICGLNNSLGELKNCFVSSNITFDKTSRDGLQFTTNLRYGGIVGVNYSGVVDYAISDANITINDSDNIVVGGVCGVSEYGIFDNIISRGSVTLNKINTINASNMIGTSRYGYIKSAIVDTPINVNIKDMASNVRPVVNIGALTMFETSSNSENTYNAELSPHFYGVLLMGENVINADGNSTLNADLGLYNKYSRQVEKPSTGGNDDQNNEDDGQTEFIPELKLPLIFDNVYIVKSDEVNKNYRRYKTVYNRANETMIMQDGLKDEEGAYIEEPLTTCPKVYLTSLSTNVFVTTCVKDLGFKCGAGFDEIVFPTSKISDIKFTLPEEKAKIGYFNKNTKNNSYSDFDKFFDGNGGLDVNDNGELLAKTDNESSVLLISDKTKNYLMSDQEEFLSYLIYLVNNGKDAKSPIVVSRKYLEAIHHCNFSITDENGSGDNSEDQQQTVAEVNSGNTMATDIDYRDLITALEKHIYLKLRDNLANPATKEQDVKEPKEYDGFFDEKTNDGSVGGVNETSLRYVLFTLITPNQTYRIRLDVGYLVNGASDTGMNSDYFILYLSFE